MAETKLERECAGCGQTDDHPRVTVVRSLDGSVPDELYHYDCLPDEHRANADDGVQAAFAATSQGLRGADVAQAVRDQHEGNAA